MMGTIKVKNLTTLKDCSALFRAALYLSGDRVKAMAGGIDISMQENACGNKMVKITEGSREA